MKHTLLFWGAICCFLSPLLGQKLKVLNPIISTDSLRFIPLNNKDGHWRILLQLNNQTQANITIEGAAEIEHPYRKLLVRNQPLLRAGETVRVFLFVPIDYDTEGQERQITLLDEAENVLGSFGLQTPVPRPTFSKRPSGWTSVRENRIYPLRVTFGNATDQVMLLDSLVWDSAATDSSLRFKRWALERALPEQIVPRGQIENKIRIWTTDLYATIAGEFLLYYHYPDGTQGVLPFAHAFGVEPNIWVEEGGQWQVGTIPYGQKISRNFWITHEGAECITLLPEYENLLSVVDTTLCPGDTTYGIVQYPTICDSVGELDVEIALFVKEFSGHVPFRFRGNLQGTHVPPSQWLAVKDTLVDLGHLKLNEQKYMHRLSIYNRGPVALKVDKMGFSQFRNYYDLDSQLEAKLSAQSIPAGGSITADLKMCFRYLPPSEIMRYFNIAVSREDCPDFKAAKSVKIIAELKP